MSSGIFNIGLNNANGSLVLTKSGTMTLDFSQTGPAGYQVPSARTVTAGVGLTGGGSLTSDITIDAEFGTTAGTICQGNDARLSDARTPTSHTHPLSQLTQSGALAKQVAYWNGSAWVPQAISFLDDIEDIPATFPPSSHTHPASEISDSTAAGRTILTAADAAAQRTALGLGTVATQDANNVTLTGGTLQGVGVVTGSYTSNANEAILRSCRKASAGTITKGQVVYIVGSTGVHLTVELSDADTESTSSKTFGIAAENITNSTEGYVMVEGLLTGLSNLPSTSFADGDALWLSSTTGGWQNTPPANPAHGVYLGRVIKASNGSNAQAYIRIQNGYELNELHDVVIASPLDTHSVYYETATQLWKNRAAVDADLAAITVFPRFDADQSATATQKRTARRNIGFSDSFTTAELLALGATESEKLRVAYCSDCISSAANTPTGRGDLVYWNGFRWLTTSDRMPITTDRLEFTLNCGRFFRDLGYTPSVVMGGDQPGQSGLSVTSNLQAIVSGATVQSIDSTADWVAGVSNRSASTGTTAGASGRLIMNPANPVFSSAGAFTIGMVCCHTSTVSSPSSNDSYHVRYGVETFVNGTSSALQNDMCCLITDQQNLLGLGASGLNWRALVRINGTTLAYVDTGVAIGNKCWLVSLIEPTSGSNCRFRVATAGDLGSSFTTHADQTAAIGATQIHAMVAIGRGSAVSATNRTSRRRFIRYVGFRENSDSTNFVS